MVSQTLELFVLLMDAAIEIIDGKSPAFGNLKGGEPVVGEGRGLDDDSPERWGGPLGRVAVVFSPVAVLRGHGQDLSGAPL